MILLSESEVRVEGPFLINSEQEIIDIDNEYDNSTCDELLINDKIDVLSDLIKMTRFKVGNIESPLF